MATDAEIRAERRRVYGEPKVNHLGIAMQIAPLLAPWWERIRNMKALPPHVIALLMCGIKLNRKRIAFHEDNYQDDRNYAAFAEKWQSEFVPEPGDPGHPVRERIYVAGPYSHEDPAMVSANVTVAAMCATAVMQRGHLAHCPHASTHPIDMLDENKAIGYEDYMELDFSIIRLWATGVLVIGDSPGTRREIALAESLGIPIYRSLDELVPTNPCAASGPVPGPTGPDQG